MSLANLLRGTALAAAAIVMTAGTAYAIEAEALAAVNVRSGPGTSFDIVDTLTEGEVVDVVECNASETWCRIMHPGPDGWVSRSYLGPVSDDADGADGPEIEFGVTIPLPGGGTITFGTPGFGGGGGGGGGAVPPRVCVYDLPNYLGASTCVNAGVSSASIGGAWNDRVTSLRTFGGASIRLCQNVNFGGFCNVFNNDVPMLGGPLNNQASSYDVMPPEPARVCVYDLPNYQGASACVSAGASDDSLGALWNDKITSIRVFGGATIRLCQNPFYGGFCNVFNNDVPTLGGALNNQASSYETY